MSILKGLKSNYRLFGCYGVFLVAKTRLFGTPRQIAVAADGIKHPIHLRLRTTDISVFEEIIVYSEYQFNPSKSPQVIIDAGANIGLTSVYFANHFPAAKILAIEPEYSNFQMLEQNASYYPNIIPIHGALWREETQLNLSNPGTGKWGYQTEAGKQSDAAEGNVHGMTIDKLMAQYGFKNIDILKIDIEGSEKEVFETSASWIDKVGVVIVELHDHFKNGCSRSVYSATKDFEMEWRKGETNFFVRKDYAPQSLQQPPESKDHPSPEKSNILTSRIVSVIP